MTGDSRAARLGSIDLLRFAAAAAVLLFHFTFFRDSTHRYPDWLTDVTRYGYLGVDLFFVISGFVVLMSAWQRTPSAFLASRGARLYPAYWIGVTLATVVVVVAGLATVRPGQYVANMTMFQAWLGQENIDPVYWTLRAELTFYLYLLVLLMIGLTRTRLLVVMWVWLALSALWSLVEPGGPIGTIGTKALMPASSHYFVIGMALFLWHRFGRSWAAALLVLAGVTRILVEAPRFAAEEALQAGRPVPAAPAVVVACLVVVVMWWVADGRAPALERRWVLLLGALTYPLYLVHDQVGVAVYREFGDANAWLVLAVLTAGVLLLAYLVHRLVERPVARPFRRRLARSLRPLDALTLGARGAPAADQEPSPGAGTSVAPARSGSEA